MLILINFHCIKEGNWLNPGSHPTIIVFVFLLVLFSVFFFKARLKNFLMYNVCSPFLITLQISIRDDTVVRSGPFFFLQHCTKT